MLSFNLWPDPMFQLRVQGVGFPRFGTQFKVEGFAGWAARLRGSSSARDLPFGV